MNHTPQPGVEQVRAQLIAQIQYTRRILVGEMRLSMKHRMDACQLSMHMEALIVSAGQEVPSFIARPHAAAFDAFKAKLLAKPKRIRRSKGAAA